MTTPDLTLAARLDDLARKSIRQKITGQTGAVNYAFAVIEAYSTNQLITAAEADARVEAAVLAGNAMVKQLDTMMLMLSGETAMTKPSLERALSGALDARNMWTDAIRSRGVTG